MSKQHNASSKGASEPSRDSSGLAINLPRKVRIREVGLREGFQTIQRVIATEEKLKLIKLLNQTGVKDIELTSFVRADKVPQMADAAELVEKFTPIEGINYTALYLNQRGFTLSRESKKLNQQAWIQAACSETFLAKNAGTSLAQIVSELPKWLELFNAAGLELHGVMLSTSFGCSYEGEISEQQVTRVIEEIRAAVGDRLPELCLADTMGWGNPAMVKDRVALARKLLPQTEISLHLHDTRGLGIANAFAGLEMGVAIFDASVGGVGGCPFAPGAAGNIATEDFAYLCAQLGIETGLDLEKYIDVSKQLSKLLGYDLPGHLYRAGLKGQQ